MKTTLIAASILALSSLGGWAQASPLASAAAGLDASAYSQSGAYASNDANAFFNGNVWNAGGFDAQWAQVDLGSTLSFSSFSYETLQSPNGLVSQKLYVSDSYIGGNYASLTPVATFSGYTTSGTPVTLNFAPVSGRYFEVVAEGGPSWTALSGAYVTAAAVPEPATYAMLLAGLALTGVVARRRKAD